MPSIRNVGIHPDNPFRYHYDLMSLELLKIQITAEPFLVGVNWHYYVIVVFDKLIAIMRGGTDLNWRILPHQYLAPSLFVDAILDGGRIYASTAPHGDVLVWQPEEYGEFFFQLFLIFTCVDLIFICVILFYLFNVCKSQ